MKHILLCRNFTTYIIEYRIFLYFWEAFLYRNFHIHELLDPGTSSGGMCFAQEE